MVDLAKRFFTLYTSECPFAVLDREMRFSIRVEPSWAEYEVDRRRRKSKPISERKTIIQSREGSVPALPMKLLLMKVKTVMKTAHATVWA